MSRAREALIHRLPLTGFDVEVTLPRDLTEAEAQRICLLVTSLAFPPREPPKEEETER